MTVLLLVFLGLFGAVIMLFGLAFLLTGLLYQEKDVAAWGAGMLLTPAFVAAVALLASH